MKSDTHERDGIMRSQNCVWRLCAQVRIILAVFRPAGGSPHFALQPLLLDTTPVSFIGDVQ